MSFYEFVLFVHITAAILWIGSGFVMLFLAARADAARDEVTLTRVFNDVGFLSNRLFMPASLTVFVAGVALTIDAWEFDQLWIVLGLAGYLATFVTGAFVLGPRAKKLGESIGAARGEVSPQALLEMRRVLTIARFDYVVLFLVVATMALKPTGDDGLLLAAMALILVAGGAWVRSKARAVDSPRTADAPAVAA